MSLAGLMVDIVDSSVSLLGLYKNNDMAIVLLSRIQCVEVLGEDFQDCLNLYLLTGNKRQEEQVYHDI